MATTKIKDLLKCIVNCSELYSLFETVTKDFNYLQAKSNCLVSVGDGAFTQSKVILPDTVGQRLAFIFCLLVEFDKGSIGFNNFLMTYYPEDGSYYASYQAFCDTVIKGLRDAVAQAFEEELSCPDGADGQAAPNSVKAELISVINLAVMEEKQFILSSTVPEEDKEGGLNILEQIVVAVREENLPALEALICGYNYFVLYHKCISEGVASLIKTIAAFEHTV